MNCKHYALILGLVLVVGALIAGCAQAPQQAGEIKIGIVASMTGAGSNVGKHMWQSAVMAADEINTNGGVFVKDFNKKIPVRVIQGDDESSKEGAIRAVTKLTTLENVDILVGGYGSSATAASQGFVADQKIPYIVTGASSTDITHRTDINTSYFFHHVATTFKYGEYTTLFVDQVIRPAINAKFNFSPQRPLRLALLIQDSLYGKGVRNGVNNTITKYNLSIDVVAEQSFKIGETDFRTALTAIKAAKPDVLYPAAFPQEGMQIVPQARRDVGLDTIILAVETNDHPDYYTGIARYGEFSIIESQFSPYTVPKSPVAARDAKFKSDYKAKYGMLPDLMGATTYEGVYVAAKAIENAGTLNKAAVRDSLAQLEMPQLVSAMKGGIIKYSKDYREAEFDLFMEQLIWDSQIGECRPKIVWPDNLKETDFVLPDWYKPGSD